MARTETVTVVFTDLVGSTELASSLGHDAYESLRYEHFSTLRRALAKYGGTEVKTTGDGLMLRFDSAAAAIACAVTMQQAVTSGRQEVSFGPGAASAVQIRIGASSGEATVEDDDLYGLPVVEASRLCAAAQPGQIVVSEVIHLMANGHGHTFTSVGELALKGLPEPVVAFEVKWEPVQPESAAMPLPPRLTPAGLAMFGRAAESETIAAAWARAKEGQRQFALVAGEPGIGKTRLATETALAAHAEGAVVLLGTCDEDVNLPYQPFVQAVRHYVAHAREDVLTAHVREHKGELARLAPELGQRVAGLPAPQVAEADTERYLLFEAVVGLLSAASQHEPMVLILDDLHWAGAPELLLLKHILRSTVPLRLLIIGTYRDTDLTRSHPLMTALADFRRESGVERIALRGLDESAVVGLVTAAAGHDLPEAGIALARALQRETEGSPFFIGEILRHLSESGAIFQEGDRWTYRGDIAGLGIPEGIREVIGRRLNRLSAETNKVLSIAAVIGRQFDVALLARAAGATEDTILDALDEAAAAALVAEVPGSPDHFSFSHALTRTTLYEELSPERRGLLHRRVGEELESLTGANPTTRIDELAHHWLAATQAVDPQKAVRYVKLAGERALANLAFEEAAQDFERALSALQPQGREDEGLRCDLLIALSDAQRRAANPEYSQTAAKAADVARSIGDGERLALAILGYARPGGFMTDTNVVNESLVSLYEEADRALAGARTLVRARILAQLAGELVYSLDRDRRLALVRDAFEIARETGDPIGLARVISIGVIALNDPMTLHERTPLVAELARLARQTGGRELELIAAFHTSGLRLETGDIEGSDQALEIAQRLTQELRQPFYAWWMQLARAQRAIMRAQPDAELQAMAAFQVGMEGGQPDAATLLGPQMFMIRRDQGRLAELVDVMQARVQALPHVATWRAALALLYCETDRLEEAREQMAILAAERFPIAQNWTWVSSMLTLSDVCDHLRDGESAAVLYERLLPVADQFHVLGNFVLCSGSLHYGCGLFAGAMRQWDTAERHCAAAVERNDRLGARNWAVRSRRALAQVLIERNAPGDPARARAVIDAGLAAARERGLGLELSRLERLRDRL